MIESLAARELAALLKDPHPPLLLDVRETWEFQLARIEGAVNIPMSEITRRVTEIPQDRAVACLCHHGVRSMQVALFLQQQGIQTLYNVTGGIAAWSQQVDPRVPTY